jgi:L-threonylcarbamoyladenylate synthase
VQRIYEIKQRSDSKSMLVLMAQISMLNQYLESVPEQALEIIRSASKPTTIIYPDARNLAPNLIAADGTIGIRITTDEFCRQLIGLTGVPIVSTSANSTGKPAPGSFSAIDPSILQEVDHVVRWRQHETGSPAPSAIIRLDDHGKSTIIRA